MIFLSITFFWLGKGNLGVTGEVLHESSGEKIPQDFLVTFYSPFKNILIVFPVSSHHLALVSPLVPSSTVLSVCCALASCLLSLNLCFPMTLK